jgi:hypothetical protein
MDSSTTIQQRLKVSELVGFILLLILVVTGPLFLPSSMHYFRLLVGLFFGYVLARSYTGFAGSVNRAYRNGSSRLMRTMLLMFLMTAIANVAFIAGTKDITIYKLEINPINLGLLLGALFFGFGMSLSSCCATGTLTDLASDFPRAGVTFVFFTIGVFLGFPLQNTQSWIKNSWFTSPSGKLFKQGVYLPDWFKWDHTGGYLGAIVLTALLVAVFSYTAYLYEKKRRRTHQYVDVDTEKYQIDAAIDDMNAKENLSTYEKLFLKPWTLKQGAVGLTIGFILLMGITKAGWGASTPYGIWFGKFINLFGVSTSSLAGFTHLPEVTFSTPWLGNPITVQDLGIFLGSLIFILTSGLWTKTLQSVTKLNAKNTCVFALGGFTMGFGTRMANGCNVGALYSPIAELSLSGWIFFVFLVLGAIIGNKFFKKVFN